MSYLSFPQPSLPKVSALPTYRRTLGANELSYFLPSRAYGLNDCFGRLLFRAPAGFVSPLRLHLVWAIMRLRSNLLACRIEMVPGCYDEAEFVYTPPASSSEALAEAEATSALYNDITGPELIKDFLGGPRKLSSHKLSRLEIACHGQVAPGVHEYHMVIMAHHSINEGLAIQKKFDLILQLLAGSSSSGGPVRTDTELAKLLDFEWRTRWSVPHPEAGVIIPAAETRLSSGPRSRFHEAAWRVDDQIVQRRSIGGHMFPRVKCPTTKPRIVQVKFDAAQTRLIAAKCKAARVTIQNAAFALCNFAWIRLCAAHPELKAPKELPMMMYTAISLQRHLPPLPSLMGPMSLALGYCNVVLPAFLPVDTDARRMFWARSRAAQRQVFAYSHSPLLPLRAQVVGAARGARAKAFARQDDEADGTLPRRPATPRAPAAAPSGPPPAPSIALLGTSHLGDITSIYHTDRYPSVELVDSIGGGRKAPGGMIFCTRTFLGRFNMFLVWDADGFRAGIMEEFWRNLVDGVHELLLEDPSGTAEERDCLMTAQPRGRGRL
ncbi:hypothetical protein B0H15DRAFT_942423 [Mycena belliarum]|uniref:Alcohol acetyltransferase n=1 Tax=Mycena belliarum TaxID=1033014 RepID=A0AAD6UKZ5_9AGAR|nr:hypothetical protein B0H15DRAFT_942423 [Mycena belliae]